MPPTGTRRSSTMAMTEIVRLRKGALRVSATGMEEEEGSHGRALK